MDVKDFYILTLSEVDSESLEDLTALVFEHGALGTEEFLPFEQNNREYEPITLEHKITQVKIYFAAQPAEDLIAKVKAHWPQVQIQVDQDQHKDWLLEWRKRYKPFRIAEEVWIVPSWLDVPAEAQIVLRLDPGMAFGTGNHETTTLAAQLISQYRRHIKSFLDVGTGTGILALLAEKLGSEKILANDIDVEARRVVRENLPLNDSQFVEVTDLTIEQIAEEQPEVWDWVVANIIDGVLVKIQESLKNAVAPHGYLLLTGILAEREKLFLTEFSFTGFSVVERKQLGEWVGYLLKRNEH